MNLTETEKAIFRFLKQEQVGTWEDLVKDYLGEIYHYNMKILDVHRIVYKMLLRMTEDSRFEVGKDKIYEVLLTQANDFDFRFLGVNKQFTVEEIIEGQLETMLCMIRLSNTGWVDFS